MSQEQVRLAWAAVLIGLFSVATTIGYPIIVNKTADKVVRNLKQEGYLVASHPEPPAMPAVNRPEPPRPVNPEEWRSMWETSRGATPVK